MSRGGDALFCEGVIHLLLVWEDSYGNSVDRCSRRVLGRRRGLGIFPLGQELTSLARNSGKAKLTRREWT